MIYSKDLSKFSDEEYCEEVHPMLMKSKRLLGTSNAIMLTFSTEYFPDYVHFGNHIWMKVRRFRPNPIQFRNCIDFGHISDDCVNEERCYKCSKAHEQFYV